VSRRPTHRRSRLFAILLLVALAMAAGVWAKRVQARRWPGAFARVQGGHLWVRWETPARYGAGAAPPSRLLADRWLAGIHYVVVDVYVTTSEGTAAIVSRNLYVPLWQLAVPPVVLLVLWAGHVARVRRRRDTGCCASCGYDLRASPERCPECGRPV
jgi:hypothetical protein